MDFSKPKNLILLIISLLLILSLAANVSLAWFRFSSSKSINKDATVLEFNFKTDNVYKQDITITLDFEDSSNYSDTVVAPGVRGYHNFVFSNEESDVPVLYTVTFNKSESVFPGNMVFYNDDSYSSSGLVSGTAVWSNASIAKGASQNKTFAYEWVFYDNATENAEDEAFNNSYDSITLKFTITAYQQI